LSNEIQLSDVVKETYMMQRWIHSLLSIFIITLLVSIPVHQCTADQDEYGLLLVSDEKDTPKPIADFLTIKNEKSPLIAFIYSAVIPGSGELYVGKKRGIAFMAVEITLWSAYAVLHGKAGDLRNNYVKYVDEHILFEPDSPATSTKNWTLEDYEHATQADNWHYVYTDNNGKPIDRVGKFYWEDLPEDKIDESGEVSLSESNSRYRVEAYSKRGYANTKYKQAKRYLSMVVVNHLISAIDARVSAIMRNRQSSQTATNIYDPPSFFVIDKLGAYLVLNNSF
jgi:hypothetical protein